MSQASNQLRKQISSIFSRETCNNSAEMAPETLAKKNIANRPAAEK
jgi:hypothetical protein